MIKIENIHNTRVSIVIATHNRRKDLSECLDSILVQSHVPNEVVVVDNSDNNESENLIKNKKKEFEKTNIFLKYIRSQRENSAAIARNIGVKNAKGDIIFSLDDDVILDKNYIKEILKVYRIYPNALGVHGYIAQEKVSKIRNLISKIFFHYQLEKNGCRILPSVTETYPYPLDKIISCEWLSGANLSYRKETSEEFEFDEKLKVYSSEDDLDLSYRIFRKYPGSLYITPYAKVIHKASLGGRLSRKEMINRQEIYNVYIFYKIFDQTLKNKLIFVWSKFGNLIFNVCRSIFKLSLAGLIDNIYFIRTYSQCIKHLKEIKRGDLDFFNDPSSK